jgi:predicted AAA+ superfamily ATPase
LGFKRHINNELEYWRSKENRKPLLLRGARQVGKTTLIQHFANTYKHHIILNLERKSHRAYFQNYSEAGSLTEALFAIHDIPSKEKSQTLLFIDKIQESPEAIALLRYFYEDIPDLHVIAAGSLLEHVMQKVKNIPVGRVEYLYIHPLNFQEYIEAIQHHRAVEEINQVPLNDYAHTLLKDLFHQYAIIGGMPEVVKQYVNTKSLSDLSSIYESIWATYKDDVEKYAANKTQGRVINHIMNTVHLYLDQRIKFQNFGNSNYRSREVGEAFRNLNDARVIQLIFPSTDTDPPIRPNLKKSPRLQFLDTGLVNHELKIQANMLAMEDLSFSFKGAIIPHLITQELISTSSTQYSKPHFWVREKAQSSAEVDLILPFNGLIIPIEIKSGAVGKLRSLHQFINQCNHHYAVRIYGGEFSVEKHQTPIGKKSYTLMNLPYYLGTKLNDYLNYFTESY